MPFCPLPRQRFGRIGQAIVTRGLRHADKKLCHIIQRVICRGIFKNIGDMRDIIALCDPIRFNLGQINAPRPLRALFRWQQ